MDRTVPDVDARAVGEGTTEATTENAPSATDAERAGRPWTETTPRRRERAFAPNVRGTGGKARARTSGEIGASVDGKKRARERDGGDRDGGGAGARPASRLGKSVESASERGGRKKSRLTAVAPAVVGSGSRLRTARESATPAPERPRTPTTHASQATVSGSPAVRGQTPLGLRSPAPSRTSKQLVPAASRIEAKLSPIVPAPPLALPHGGVAPVDPLSSPGALALVVPPPVMAVPAHRWVRSAGSTRGGRVGEGSRRDLLEATTSYDNDPAMTIRDIIRQKSAEERANEAKSRMLKKSKLKAASDFGKKRTPEPAAPVALPGKSFAPKPAVMAPQVQVIDGNIVINPHSLTVAAAAEKSSGLDEFKRVEENGTKLNSATYANRAKAEKWSKDDTELFYRAMTQFGTDFSLIARLFPGRTRRQVKRKYLIEDRADPRRVERCISNRETDPAIYKALISVLQEQAAEADLARSNIDARVVLDGDAGEESTEQPPTEDDSVKEQPAAEPAPSKSKKKAAAAAPKGRKSTRTATKT